LTLLGCEQINETFNADFHSTKSPHTDTD
jgi:hypothetical protein